MMGDGFGDTWDQKGCWGHPEKSNWAEARVKPLCCEHAVGVWALA